MNLSFVEDNESLLGRLKLFIPTAGSDEVVTNSVRKILNEVRKGGDEAILAKTLEFDGASMTAVEMRVSAKVLQDSLAELSSQERVALEDAISNVTLFHEQSVLRDWTKPNHHGGFVGERYYPINRVGIYIPGGQVPLVSTVVMTVTLAKVAGVPEIAVVTPPSKSGNISSHLLAALQLLGVEEIYKIGGAQAVAALAYGSQTISPVDKVFGPGNAYVNEAKRQVFGEVGIDLLPGPSEIMVIADKSASPQRVAAALLAQAEHGSGKEKIYFLFQDKDIFPKVLQEMDSQLTHLSHAPSIRNVLERGFFSVYLPKRERLVEVANFIAPEHLELQVCSNDFEFFLSRITTAGAFLVGHETATSVGDFAAGPSHVLPTGRSSRFSSGLRLQDFLRRSSVIRYDSESCHKAAPVIEQFASMEKLDGHGNAHKLRLSDKPVITQ